MNVNKKSDNKKLTYILLFITLLVAILISRFSAPNNQKNENHSKVLAYNYAIEYVKKELKSPSSAKFPSLIEKENHVSYLGNYKYRINSWLESKNSFGTQIRSKYSCFILFDNGNVICENLVINF